MEKTFLISYSLPVPITIGIIQAGLLDILDLKMMFENEKVIKMKKLQVVFIAVFMVTVLTTAAQEKFGKGQITQIGLVVNNIEEASKKWAAILGFEKIPDVIITDEYEKANTQFEGKPTDARAKLAFFRLENLTIELIEPVGKKSTWYKHLKKHGEGFHHIAFGVEGMEQNIAWLENKGGKLVQKGDFTGGSYSYVDLPNVGVIIELLTSTEK